MMNKEDTTVECNPYTHTPARLDGAGTTEKRYRTCGIGQMINRDSVVIGTGYSVESSRRSVLSKLPAMMHSHAESLNQRLDQRPLCASLDLKWAKPEFQPSFGWFHAFDT